MGNAGLALITSSGAEFGTPLSAAPYGAGGVFLIDGAAVNPNVAPDVASGATPSSYASLTSISPQAATVGSGDVTLTVNGTGFSPDSTACWNCSFLQFQFLPTSYVTSTQLNVTLPASELATAGPLAISLFDQSTNLFSTNALTFTVSPASGSTQVTALNLAGLAMAWDATSQLIYVGTADYDGAYPNSIVGINGANGTIMESQPVSPDPDILSDGAGGQFLYATGVTENSNGMLYLIQNSTFVSNTASAAVNNVPMASPVTSIQPELVQQRWHRLLTKEILNMVHNRGTIQ